MLFSENNFRRGSGMSSVIVVGIQWGDEGKGKVIDLLSEHADHVVRAQGGNNAGHTIKIKEEEFRFHLVPSGILYAKTHCYIAGGTVIDPGVLLSEIDSLENRGIKVAGRLSISPHAHLILPYHRELDRLYEIQKGAASIGTTGRGIGPCYADKALRIGLRMAELVNPEVFRPRLQEVLDLINQQYIKIFELPPLSYSSILEEYEQYALALAPYVIPFEQKLDQALKGGRYVLFEGAHGTLLDTTFGTYPFVTSSSTLSAGVLAGAGVGPTRVEETLGVVKAYTTRVGNGPFPTELTDVEQPLFLDCAAAREVGTTTGRNRRMGWFDAPIVRYTIALNGVDALALMKLDVLDSLKEIKICTGYRLRGELLEAPPALVEEFALVEPIYETWPGWNENTSSVNRFADLPPNAQGYVKRLEALLGVPIVILSVGPEREKTVFIKKFFSMK